MSEAKKTYCRVYIESRHRPSHQSNPSNFTYELNTQFRNVTKVAITDVNIVNSQYNINSTNNTIKILEDTPNTFTASIPIGDYAYDELATELQTQLNAEGGFTYTVSTDPQSKTFTIDGGVGNTIRIYENGTTIDTVLGFTQASGGYYNTASQTATSDNLWDLTGLRNVYILSPSFPIKSILKNQFMNVIQKVTLGSFGTQSVSDGNRDRLDFINLPENVNVSQVKLILLDKNLQELDSNQLEWSCILHLVGEV